MDQPKYRRMLRKLSGEALSAGSDGILNFPFVEKVAKVIHKCVNAGVEVAVIVGAGNIWRGRQGGKMDRNRADYMGMLATVINSIALQDTFIAEGMDAVVLTSVPMKAFADPYTARDADADARAITGLRVRACQAVKKRGFAAIRCTEQGDLHIGAPLSFYSILCPDTLRYDRAGKVAGKRKLSALRPNDNERRAAIQQHDLASCRDPQFRKRGRHMSKKRIFAFFKFR